MRQVFLDHQSTTPVLPEVLAAMTPYFSGRFGAPASLHHFGLEAREALEKAREQIAALINAESPERILFTSGGTESANLAVKGGSLARQRDGKHIVVSATEHLSVLNSVEAMTQAGFTHAKVGVDFRGIINPADVEAALTDETVLLCVHQVNHEIGAIQPIAEIGRLARARGVPLFVDAVASGGWHPIDVQAMGASFLSLSPHRFYGPKGVGILYRNPRARLVGIQHGGSQEGGWRAGTENVPAIVGAGVAAEIAQRELAQRRTQTAELQARLWRGLETRIPHIQLNGPPLGPERISTNLNVSAEFVEGEGLLLLCDMQGVAVGSGPACLNKALKISHVLEAIGLDGGLARGNVVMSPGRENTTEEMDYALDVFERVVTKLRGMSPMWDEFQRGRIASVIK